MVASCDDQLYELNRCLDRLLDNLQLQQARDVKEILKLSRQNRDDLDEMKGLLKMILQQINDPEMKGLVKKLLEQNAGDSTETSTSASGSNTETEGSEEAEGEFLGISFSNWQTARLQSISILLTFHFFFLSLLQNQSVHEKNNIIHLEFLYCVIII